jgi:HD-GYP domain-containing protein (c-di-GMP phosphodiesterase class II)
MWSIHPPEPENYTIAMRQSALTSIPLHKTKLDQARDALMVDMMSSNEQPEKTIGLMHLTSDTDMLRVILDQLLTLLQAEGGALTVLDITANTPVIDLASGSCLTLRQQGLQCSTAGLISLPVMTRRTAWVSFFKQEPLVGTLCICRSSDLSDNDLHVLSAMGSIAANVLLDRFQFRMEREQVYDHTLNGWVQALELRDNETKEHTRRVTDMTVALARACGLGAHELVHIRRGALLHDIGKLAIPDRILLKAGPLTEEEWLLMRQHPRYAYEMLAPIPFLLPALAIPYYHHEHWDGNGYPEGLRGEQIPLAARIFSVIDVWDALRFDRPYRAAWPDERVRAHIKSLAGSQFDPAIVTTFLQQLEAQPHIFLT